MDFETTMIQQYRLASTEGARSDMDVEMLCNQIDMDTDTNAVWLVAVVDTNIFVSNLSELRLLVDDRHVLFVVPWVVVQELDGLKSSSVSNIGSKAQNAIRFVHDLLVSRANFVFEDWVQVRLRSERPTL